MNTKKALKALTKGAIQHDGLSGKLAERAEEFQAQYDARETRIAARKQAGALNVPMLEALRQRIAAVANTPERDTPVCMRFYAFQALKAASDRNPQDRGMIQAARHLEKLWNDEPMGSLTLGQVTDIRAHYGDAFPKSKVAKTLDAEVRKVGYSNLPVAKLARLAAQINSQEDFDMTIKSAGLEGSGMEQIQSRTLIRSLVALRTNADLAVEAAQDERSTMERVTDTLAREAQLEKTEPELELLPDESGELEMLDLPVEEPVDAPADEDGPQTVEPDAEGVESIVPMIEEVDQVVEEMAPPEAESFIDAEVAEGNGVPGTAEWGFAEAQEGHTAPPPSPEWQAEELEEHGITPTDDTPVDGELDGLEMAAAHRTAEGMDAETPPADGQYGRRNTDAPNRGQDGGKELMKDETKSAFKMEASEVEAAIIDRGEVVKYGSLSIHVNEADEIELWHKGAGRACNLVDVDVAIEDFIKAAQAEHSAAQPRAFYTVANLVPVPCARCSEVLHFEASTDPSDLYECDCGYRTKAATISTLVKHGQLQGTTSYAVQMPPEIARDPSVKVMWDKLMLRVTKMPGVRVQHALPYRWDVVVGSEGDTAAVEQALRQMGAEPRKMGPVAPAAPAPAAPPANDTPAQAPAAGPKVAQFDPGAIAAPGSADQAIAPEVTPGTAPKGPQAAPGQQSATNPEAAKAAGPLTPQDISAAFTHYKAMNLHFPEAVSQFTKDYKDKMDGWTENLNAELVNVASQLYGGLPQGQVMQATARLKLAFKNPKVNQQQPDQAKGDKSLGKFSDDKDPGRFDAPKPAKSGKQPGAGKQPGTKAPAKDMGKTNEDKHPAGLDAPKPPADGRVKGKAGDQPGTKPVSSKELGKDSDHHGKGIPTPGKFGPRPKA